MSNTSTSTNSEGQPSLTLDMILEAKKQLQDLLPVVYYRTSKYLPTVDEDGEPYCILLKPSAIGWNLHYQIPPYPPDRIVMLHPDNLPYLKRICRGEFRLVEYDT